MKFMMTTVSVAAFAVSVCKKDAATDATDASNHADSVPAYDHNSMSANNS